MLPEKLERQKAYNAKWKAENPEEYLATKLRWAKNHPEQARANRSRWRAKNRRKVWHMELMRKYSLPLEAWEAMLILQCGRCAICSDPMLEPCVDHDHETGKVRGLLCDPCNRAIGQLKEDPAILQAAVLYLQLHRS